MSEVQYSYTAKKKLKYKYTCEHCGKEVVGEYEVTGKSGKSANADIYLQEAAQKNLETSISYIEKDMEKNIYPFKGLCPYCHKHQSWEAKITLRYFYLFPIIGFVFGFFLAWILADTEVWFLPLIVLPLLGLLGAIIYFFYIKVQTRKVVNKQKPVLIKNPGDLLSKELEELLKQAQNTIKDNNKKESD